MLPLLPALLLALFAAWSGTFPGGASFSGAVSGQLALLAMVAGWGALDLDPLRLGRAGRWLLPALLVAVLASAWASPVPRAGRVGLALLPTFFLLPAIVARCWDTEAARRRGLRAVVAAVALVTLYALADWLFLASPRPAMPLGHHNLLAAWLAILTPLGLGLAALDPRAAWRGVGLAAALLAAAAVLCSGSLTGALALAAGVGITVGARRRGRAWALAGAALLVLPLLPRLPSLFAGKDPSAAARWGYWQAGWRGFAERPWLGWGPGATPWSAGRFLQPVPGVHPPSEVVGQLHSLPVELAFELGGTGLLLAGAVALLFFARRWREARRLDSTLARAGLGGLAAGAVAALGNSWLAVTALPVALAVAAGAALAGERDPQGGLPSAPSLPALRPRDRLGAALYAAVALTLLVGPGRALRHYEAARQGVDAEAVVRHLGRAVELDPAFPLYRARLAWYVPGTEPAAAREAAEGAPGVAALWLSAGVLGGSRGEPWAAAALSRALSLDPLGSIAPLVLAEIDPLAAQAPPCAARALLADPRLGALLYWEGEPDLLRGAAAALRRWPGVDAGWREAVAGGVEGSVSGPREGPVVSLAYGAETGAESLSLHAFRRRPWSAPWFVLSARAGPLAGLDFPPAGALPESSASAFPGLKCSPGEETP